MQVAGKKLSGGRHRRLELAPDALAANRLVQRRQVGFVLGQFGLAGLDHRQAGGVEPGQHHATARARVVVVDVDQQRVLAAGHGQPDFRQQLRVEQGAVQRPVRIGDAEAVAQRVQRVALAREQRARVQQRVGDRFAVLGDRAAAGLGQLGVEELHVERGVVRDQLGALDELDELVGDVAEARLVGQEFGGQAVDRQRLGVAVAVRVQVDVQVVAGGHPVDQFDAADFDDAVSLGGIQPGGFSVKDDLAHKAIPTLGPQAPTAPGHPPGRPGDALRCRPGRVSCVRWRSGCRPPARRTRSIVYPASGRPPGPSRSAGAIRRPRPRTAPAARCPAPWRRWSSGSAAGAARWPRSRPRTAPCPRRATGW